MMRARIVAEGRRSFEQSGYVATTLEDIARGVGLGRTALYQYFPGKSDIMRQAIEDDERLFIGAFAFALSDTVRDRSVTEEHVRDLLALYRVEGGFLRVISEAAANDPDVSNWLEENFQKLISSIVERADPDRAGGVERLRVRVWMAISATDNLFQRLLDARWSLDEELAVQEVTQLWWSLNAAPGD